MHLIINLVFLISFQSINLSNFKWLVITLWVNNRCKWITVILINLCDNLLYYMIYLCLLCLCIIIIIFFQSLAQSHYRHYDFIMHHQQTLYHFYSLKVELLFLLLWLIPILLPNYHTTNSQRLIFSLISLSLSLVTNTESQFTKTQRHSHKAKKKKKKNTSTNSLKHKHPKHRFWDFEG